MRARRAGVSAPLPRWGADLGERALRLLPLKAVGISAFVWIFFVAYFQLLRHPPHPVAVMPLTELDRWIPFQPSTLLAYLSLWVYVGVAPGLMLRLSDLLLYGGWAAALCLTGLACFYLWPTTVPRLALPASDFPGFATLQGVDAAGNACPSMHVAIAIFSACWIDRLLRLTAVPPWLRLVNAAWFVAIAWSTLAVKQHVVLDVVAGASLGSVFAGASLRLLPAGGQRPIGADIIARRRLASGWPTPGAPAKVHERAVPAEGFVVVVPEDDLRHDDRDHRRIAAGTAGSDP